VDLPRNQASGLVQSMELLKDIPGIDFIILDTRDVIRHKLVTSIINAYDKGDK
jgi:phosphate starvation-inducible PhoH-like protein